MNPCISEKPPGNVFMALCLYTLKVLRNAAYNAMKSHRYRYLLRYDAFFRGSVTHMCGDLSLSKRDVTTVLRRYENEGISFLTKTLPLLAKAMEQGIATRNFQCPSSFKKSGPGSALPAFLGSQFRTIFDHEGRLLDDPSVYSVYIVRQLCYHWYKVDLPSDPILDQKVITDFLRTERELKSLNIVEDSTVRFARDMITSVFSGFNRDDTNCKHGPGVSNGVRYQYQKYEKKLSPLASVWSQPLSHFFNGNDFWNRYDRLPHRSIFDFTPFVKESANRAKVILVPKDSRGPRLISCEPVENQFTQQGIMDFMVTTLENHRFTKGQVNFTSQKVNRDLAKLASLDQSFSTLDLKEASDRVSNSLVRVLFKGALGDALQQTRSTSTELPDGSHVVLEKFAPMGSATCFPVLASVIYFIILAYLVQECGVDFNSARSGVFVYGDDIIVRTEYVPFCHVILPRVGLMINRDKSFVNSLFAESCGFDAFLGNDVTPLRMKKGVVSLEGVEREEASRIVPLVQFANSLQTSGLLNYSEWIYSICEKSLGPLPYGPLGASYLCRIDEYYATERTYLEGRGRFRYRRNRRRYPMGGTFVVKRYVSKRTDNSKHVSSYGHMQRIWRKTPIDRLEFITPRIIPEYGIFTRPNDNILMDVSIGHDLYLY